MEVQVLFDTLANSLEEMDSKTLGEKRSDLITLALVVALPDTMADMEPETFGETIGNAE